MGAWFRQPSTQYDARGLLPYRVTIPHCLWYTMHSGVDRPGYDSGGHVFLMPTARTFIVENELFSGYLLQRINRRGNITWDRAEIARVVISFATENEALLFKLSV